MAKEELLRNLEARLAAAQQQVNSATPPPPSPIGSGPASTYHDGYANGMPTAAHDSNGLQ